MKVTILSLDLYGFNKFIANELQNKGIEATYINSAAFKHVYKNFGEKIINFFSKTILKKNLKKNKQTQFVLDKILNEIQDITLVVDPAHFNHTILKEVRKKSKKLIAYNYDSMAQLPLPADKMSYFDEIYSFDKNDCKKHDFKFITNFIYLPKSPINFKNTLKAFTIQSKSKDRIFTLSKIADQLDSLNIKNYEFLVYGKVNTKINKNIIFFNERIGLETFQKRMDNSEILLDLVRDGQNGLSFRIFEAMALQKKLITTNKNIIDYDFYNPNNILVIDAKNPTITTNFLKSNYQPIPENIYNKYTLNNWIKTVINI
ncbi:hypothetical protein [Paenimyroides viscosum]|uniref:Glycosyltransferase family 1 protein n=1 Tax=Paenimyroides viscosum TaxID=2488729 RepID=A0A3P1B5B6_9FLAO|nr:hypothetical protein [Paenimyroides viscosum]RRA96218.1 hypothetical protein EG242_03065 [Paenimyroides viscosum]